MKILIITGGNSSEREISLLSANEVKNALLKKDYEVTLYDLNQGYEPLRKISQKADVLFPVLHGEEGEGGKLHKFLSKLGKPVVGSKNYKGFKKAWYKIPFKQFCDKNNILNQSWQIVKKPQDIVAFGFPCVVKSSAGGSSREVFILINKQEFEQNEKEIFKYHDLFVEQYIKGKEATVGIFNNKALPVIQIIPPENSWFNYENKYSNSTQELVDSPYLSGKTKKVIQAIALNIHRHFNLGAYSRIDFMLDGKDNPYVMDVNTIPGLTASSLLPKETGMPFAEFIDKLVKLSLDKKP